MLSSFVAALKRAFRPSCAPAVPAAPAPATEQDTAAAMRAFALELRRGILDLKDWDLKRSMAKVATATDAMAAIVAADPKRARDAWPVLDSALPRTREVLGLYLGLERTPYLGAEDEAALAEVRLVLIGMADAFEAHLNALRGASLTALAGGSDALEILSAYDAPSARPARR